MGKVPRLYLDPDQFGESEVGLYRENRHYLNKVLRLRADDKFAAMDGLGKAWLCSLREQGKAKFVAKFEAVPPHSCSVTVGLALCKGTRFETAIESLAEMGVTRIIPLTTERSERKQPSEQRLVRWKNIATSASAVAYRLIPMKLDAPLPLNGFLESHEDDIFFCHPGGSSATALLKTRRPHLTILIGPEGGFTEGEIAELSERGSKMDLGPMNLRVATAAIVSAGLALTMQAEECESEVSI